MVVVRTACAVLIQGSTCSTTDTMMTTSIIHVQHYIQVKKKGGEKKGGEG